MKGDRWRGFMGLASGSVHGHNPKVTFIFVVTGEYNAVTFFDSIEKVPATFQIWNNQV